MYFPGERRGPSAFRGLNAVFQELKAPSLRVMRDGFVVVGTTTATMKSCLFTFERNAGVGRVFVAGGLGGGGLRQVVELAESLVLLQFKLGDF